MISSSVHGPWVAMRALTIVLALGVCGSALGQDTPQETEGEAPTAQPAESELAAGPVALRVYPGLDVQFLAPERAIEVQLTDGIRLRLPGGASLTLRRTKSARDLEAVKLRLAETARSQGWTVIDTRERTLGDRPALEMRSEIALAQGVALQQVVGVSRDDALYVWVFSDRKERFPHMLAERMVTSLQRIDATRLAKSRKSEDGPQPGYGCPTCREAKPLTDRFCGVCGAGCRNLPVYGCTTCELSFTDDHAFCTRCGGTLERLGGTEGPATTEDNGASPQKDKPGASKDETPGR